MPHAQLELNASRKSRPLLVLNDDGSFDSLEHDARVRLVHRALVSGDAVAIPRFALEHEAGWVETDRAKSPAPKVRGEFCEYVVLINDKEVEKGHILQRLQVEQRRGEPTVEIMSRVTVPTPLAGEPGRKTTFTIRAQFCQQSGTPAEWRTAHAAEQQERRRVATSNAERLLQELELECAGRAAKAGNKKRRKKKGRGGAQDVQQAAGVGAAGAESISGEQGHSDEESGFVIPEQEQEAAHDQQSRQMEGEAQEGKEGKASVGCKEKEPCGIAPSAACGMAHLDKTRAGVVWDADAGAAVADSDDSTASMASASGCAQPAPDIAAPAAVVPEDMECCVCMSAKVSWYTRVDHSEKETCAGSAPALT